MDKDQFRNFQRAMDAQESEYVKKQRDNTSDDKIFDVYWEAFNSLSKEDGVKKMDIISIRHKCDMFGPNVTKEFWQTPTEKKIEVKNNDQAGQEQGLVKPVGENTG